MTALGADLHHPLPAQDRRGNARYRLAAGLTVVEGRDGGVLLSKRPLLAIRLNAAAGALLARLPTAAARQGLSAADLTDSSSAPGEAAAFLDDLWHRRLVTREPAVPVLWPSVLIIVAAHGRPAATRACVQSLLALDYPADRREIVVVDDASDPPLAPALAGLPVGLMRLDRNRGPAAARNLAAAEAEAEVLAFIDNDCVATPGWLATLVAHLDDPATAIVGGRVAALSAHGPVAAFEVVRSPLDMGAFDGPVGPSQAIAYLPACNLVVRRDLLLALGGFAPEMRVGEDADFVWRALRHGAGVRYTAAGIVFHDHRVRLTALLARRADYASSEADLQARHPANRRIQYLPRTALVALGGLTALPVFWPAAAALAVLALGLVTAELAGKHRMLRRVGVGLPFGRLVASVLRGHGAALYHLGRDVARYLGLPALALAALWPPLAPAVAVLLLVGPVVDHRRLRPAVSLPVYASLFWLEMAAYQFGVWRGCLARRCWRPLVPWLRWRR